MRSFVCVLTLCLGLVGCTTDSQGGAAERSPGGGTQPTSSQPTSEEHTTEPKPTESTTATPARGPQVTVPDETGAKLRAAREVLRGFGLEVVTRSRFNCLPNLVMAQTPTGGASAHAGDTVVLTVGRIPPAASCVAPDARAPSARFAAWARGTGSPPPFAPEVRVFQGYRQVLTLTAEQAAARQSWLMPPGYAERIEINLVDWVREQPSLRSTRGLPAYCLARHTPMPRDLARRLRHAWVLVTTDAEACMDVASVQVWVDRQRRIESVSFLSGAP